jgi:hypothetical protein
LLQQQGREGAGAWWSVYCREQWCYEEEARLPRTQLMGASLRSEHMSSRCAPEEFAAGVPGPRLGSSMARPRRLQWGQAFAAGNESSQQMARGDPTISPCGEPGEQQCP